ncbi:MAG: hypothetical protein RLZZ455_365 [Candidatus Parcubacteria bacterium]|jgi:hypothetical protein
MLRTFSRLDFLLLTLLFASTLFFWFPTISLPYWWDSAGFVMQQAHSYLIHGFSVTRASYSDFAHPPLLSMLLATTWYLFGEDVVISHIAYLPFVLFSVIGIYLLGREVVKDSIVGPVVGFATALLVLFTPTFLAQVGIVYMEIPATTFAVFGYLFFLKRRYVLSSFFFSLMVLMREFTSIIVFVFVILFVLRWWSERKKSSSVQYRNIFYMIFPILLLCGWFFYHYLLTGWWMISPDRPFVGGHAFSFDFVKLASVFSFIFLFQWRVLLFAAFVLCFLGSYFYSPKIWLRQKDLLRIDTAPLFIIPVVYLLFFGRFEFLTRYSVIVLPFLYLLVVCSLKNMISKTKRRMQVCVILSFSLVTLFFFRSEWNLHRVVNTYYYSPLEDNLEYRDVIALGKQVASYLELHHQDTAIYSSFPFTSMLADSYQGYTASSFTIRDCKTYARGNGVIIYHYFSPGSVDCSHLLNTYVINSKKKFSVNGKRVLVAEFSGSKNKGEEKK